MFLTILKKLLILLPILLIKFYQLVISPHTPSSCRYVPTCSQYGIESFKKHGLLKGGYYLSRRLLSCHPWGGSGHDPVK